MGRYRIGNDITIVWTINDRDGAALPLKDKEVHLYYTCERGRFEADFQIQGNNVIVWDFVSRLQRALGDYTLTVEILQSDGKRAIRKDICGAFTLVGKGCEESGSKGDAIINKGGEITLVTDLDIYRISPMIPYVGYNGNWFVDGVDTKQTARGPQGEVTDVAYMDFHVEEDMVLYLTFISGNNDMKLKFNLDENGYLTLDK